MFKLCTNTSIAVVKKLQYINWLARLCVSYVYFNLYKIIQNQTNKQRTWFCPRSMSPSRILELPLPSILREFFDGSLGRSELQASGKSRCIHRPMGGFVEIQINDTEKKKSWTASPPKKKNRQSLSFFLINQHKPFMKDHCLGSIFVMLVWHGKIWMCWPVKDDIDCIFTFWLNLFV